MVAALATAMTIGEFLWQLPLSSSTSSLDNDKDGKVNKKGVNIYALGLIFYMTGLATVALGSLLRLDASRSAEYADNDFAKFIGFSDNLALALERISSASPTGERGSTGLGLANGAFAHSYISNPPAPEFPVITWSGLLRTHPSTEDRVARFRAEDSNR